MRLWHKELIPVLPRLQLLSQWRECCSIAKAIQEDGTPGHILVNRVLDYPADHFLQYAQYIRDEMVSRKYNCNWQRFSKWVGNFFRYVPFANVFPNWHDDIYLRECLYNLEEKAICGGIPAEEWQLIYERFKDFTPLWNGVNNEKEAGC